MGRGCENRETKTETQRDAEGFGDRREEGEDGPPGRAPSASATPRVSRPHLRDPVPTSVQAQARLRLAPRRPGRV